MDELREGKVISRKGRTLMIECPACGDVVKGRGSNRGGSMRCPTCESEFLVPAPQKLRVRKKKRRQGPKLPVLKAGKFFECFWCKKEIEYTALRCPFCKKEQDLKLRPMLSKTWGVTAVDLIIAFCGGIFAAVGFDEAFSNADWTVTIAAFVIVFFGYFAFSYAVIGQTLMELAFGVVVIDRNCHRIGLFRGVGRAIILVLALAPMFFAPGPSASFIAGSIGVHDKVFRTYQVRKEYYDAYLSLAEERKAEFENSQTG